MTDLENDQIFGIFKFETLTNFPNLTKIKHFFILPFGKSIFHNLKKY